MAIGRISGPLLASNLVRDGVDLAFETDLLYLDVSNGRIGIRQGKPLYDLDVNGTVNASNLRVVYTGPGTGQAELGNLVITSGTIASSISAININPAPNQPTNVNSNLNVSGSLAVTGNLTSLGNTVLGNNTNNDVTIFNSKISSDLVPAVDQQYKIGSPERAWLDAYVNTLVSNKIQSSTSTFNIDGANLIQINAELKVKGENPIGTAPVITNVLHVTEDGDDTNDGRAQDPSRACRTISGAVRSIYYQPGTLIRVYSGRFLENNPILLKPNTAIVGDDLRTTIIEPINKTQDLFHVQSGCYIAQMQFSNGRSGLLPGTYVNGTNRGAYCTAFPPQVAGGKKIDVYNSPYIQNCTNQSGPWLVDGTLFVPNQTVQVPQAVGTATFASNTTTVVVTLTTGTIAVGQHVISGPQDTGFFNARTLLLSNLEFIQDQTVAWVNEQVSINTSTTASIWYGFVYSQAKCFRDVGYITQAITYDATFGGNEKSVEAGLAYYDGVINLVEGQQAQTTEAINHINTLCQAIITNTPITPLYSTATSQTINTVLTNGVVASEELTNCVEIITTIINSGTSYAPEIFVSCGPEAPLVHAELLLQKNRTFLQTEVVSYVNATYPTFKYDESFCFRDTGLIVDAVSQDLLVGGNTKSIEAGLAYYTGSKGQSSVAATAITNNFNLLKTLILGGTAPDTITGPNQGTGFYNAKDTIQKNKTFLQTEVSGYLRSLFTTTFRLTQLQQNSFYDQIGLIAQAIADDAATGGNANTVSVGTNYVTDFVSTLSPGEDTQIALTNDYMLILTQQLILQSQNAPLFNPKYTQNTSNLPATETESLEINANLDLITEIITLGPSVAPAPAPISQNITTNTNAINAFKTLQANRTYIAAELTGWINDEFGGGFNYNTATCYRDTGYIVDSVAFDILQDDNSQSIFSGLQYWNQSSYTGDIAQELTTTTAAINYAKDLSKLVVVNNTVTNLQTATTQTFNLANPGSGGTTNTISYLYNTLTNILLNGTAGVTGQIIPNSTATTVVGVVNAYNLLQANKEFIIDETITWINTTQVGFEYDRNKCARDIGFIVDAISLDLKFNGTSQSTFAGRQYWAQGTSAIPGEESTTTVAIRYVRDLALKIITNDTGGARYQTAVNQITTSTTGTNVEKQIVFDEFNTIISIINTGTNGVSDYIVPNGYTASTITSTLASYNLLVDNKNYIQSEAVAYVNNFKPQGFVYDQAKCFRDVGYMVDSVAFDLLYGGNKQAVQSGVYYYEFSQTTSTVMNEQPQVFEAYKFINSLTNYLVRGITPPTYYQTAVLPILSANTGTTAEVNKIGVYISTITNLLLNGPEFYGDTRLPIGLTATVVTNELETVTILDQNREFIKAETIAYIDAVFVKGFEYDETKCRRDLGYIIDGVSFDLLHGGNRQSVQSGVYYYGYNDNSSVLTYEIAQVTAAYNRIKEIAAHIVQGVPVTVSSSTVTTPQILLTSAGNPPTSTSTDVDAIKDRINIITDIVNNGPSTGYPQAAIKLESTSTVSTNDAFDMLLLNRQFIQEELLAYINKYFVPPFIFDKIDCSRDAKLIVDSVALDLIYEGNTQSTFAGLQYWAQGNSEIPGEITTTTAAIQYASSLTVALLGTYTEAVSSINTNTGIIVNIITSGTSGVSDIIIPNGLPSTNTATVNAWTIIQNNKLAIQHQTIDYVSGSNPGFVYNTTTCFRDVGYIIDALSFDLLHDGNRQSVMSGVYYYGFSTSTTNVPGEIPQVVAAYDRLKYLIETVIKNETVETSYQEFVPQTIIPAYGDVGSLIPGQETFTADAIDYLDQISQYVIANQPVPIVRGQVIQYINTEFEGGQSAGLSLSRNYQIIEDIIQNGPGAAPVPYSGSGFFATTGVSSNDTRESPIILAITTVTGNVYTLRLNAPTVGDSQTGVLYFGETAVFPVTNSEVEELSFEYTGNTSTWDSRKVDPIGAMGGSLVDGGVVSDRSPIQSFVYDAFTQVTQGGRGVRITNSGYAQLVSVFTIFCSVGVEVDNGGIASIVNSNSNFGDICLLASGFGARKFSGTVWNPSYPNYVPNGEYYPLGYYPQNGVVEIFLPDTDNRPHISLVMEVEPPENTIDYLGNVVPYVNEQGFSGFLNAQPSVGILTTGSITITEIDTTGIAVGNAVYIRDQFGNTGTSSTVFTPYVQANTVVTDVGYRTVTLNKALANGGADPTNTENVINTNYYNVYFCGNAYYTVLSSEINNNWGKPLNTNVLSTASLSTGTTISQPVYTSQIPAEIDSLTYLSTTATYYMTAAGVNTASITWVQNTLTTIINIISTATVTQAEAIVPKPKKKGTPPQGAGLAITTLNNNKQNMISSTIDYINTTYPGLTYNEEKCKRDLELILRQIAFDLEFGGNYYATYAGLSYWNRAGTHHIVNLEEAVRNTALFPDGVTVNFYQRSYMSASGYVFEYVGAGTNYSALPQRGIKDPEQGKEVVQVNNGKIFFTSTDQNGDFRIGPGLVISQATGVLSGRTFTKSLFANMTPFILAIEGS
jgi:hypothetical protein